MDKLKVAKTEAVKAKVKRYAVTTGFNFGCTADDSEGTRVEIGPLTEELPEKVFKSLLAQGVIVEVKE